jgi:DNA-binding transcriptional LysR family regulator
MTGPTMTGPLPPLSALPAFEATIRLGSMTAAGQALGRSHGAISRQISGLEDALGVILIDRQQSPLRPTAAGAALYAATVPALEGLRASVARIRPEPQAGAVTLACGSTFATRWLVPRLPRFYERHPEVRLTLSMISASGETPDTCDLMLSWSRVGPSFSERHDRHVLGDAHFALVCAPDYPHHAADGRLVAETELVADWTLAVRERLGENPALLAQSRRHMRFPHIHLCIEAAIGGLGVTLVERRLAEPELARGELIAPLAPVIVPDGLVALVHPRRALHAAGRKLLHWLSAEAAGETSQASPLT